MRLTTTTNVTLDGVMQGLGGSGEDRRGGFERGGWAMPLYGAEVEQHISDIYTAASAFLFGRRTFDVFAASWGAIPEMQSLPIGVALNARPKYLVSNTVTDPQWANTTVLNGDLASAIRALKADGDGDIVVPGSGVLVRWLLANDLVDELDLLTYPVVIGQGTRLFAADGPDIALDLIRTRTTANGVTIQTWRPAGRPEYETNTVISEL